MRHLALLVATLLSLLLAAPAQASEAPPPAPTINPSAMRLDTAPAPVPHYRLSTQGISERMVFLRTWGATAGGALGTSLVFGLINRGAAAVFGTDSLVYIPITALNLAASLFVPAACAWYMNDAPFWVNLLGMGAGWAAGVAIGVVVVLAIVVLAVALEAAPVGAALGIIAIGLVGGGGALVVSTLGPAFAWRIWKKNQSAADPEPVSDLRLAPALMRDNERHLAPGLALTLSF
ncbi:MAG: hypothetical protein H6741_25710 [Alphaproteobacteria bacterium]|nr:hypothetical protein [Alphaproteobacteria bacterium]MCB9796108.1 hypothetical protein [Alphaproteobacteria bacterium]